MESCLLKGLYCSFCLAYRGAMMQIEHPGRPWPGGGGAAVVSLLMLDKLNHFTRLPSPHYLVKSKSGYRR